MTKTAVYAGSFDPLTNGHVWMIEQGAQLFDELVVAIGVNPEKRYTFSLDERVAMLEETVRSMPNARVATFENQFLVRYAASVGAQYILRGIRNAQDYEFERTMRYMNGDLDSDAGIKTIFMMPPREIAEVSSSSVKGLVGPEGWQDAVKRYVPGTVYLKFLERFATGTKT